MDKVYITLLTDIVHATELVAEQTMNLNKENNDLKGYNTSKIMRDDYATLYDKMRANDFDSTTLTKRDYAKIMVGMIIISQQLEKKIETEQKILQGYKTNTIPKLDRIINCTDDEEAIKLAEEIFQVEK